MFSKTLVVLASASAAFATVFITSPTAASVLNAGQPGSIVWQDSGVAPSLAEFGPAKISIYAGNARQQTSLQLISNSTDVSKVSSLAFTPDATIGPEGQQYFIRIESLSLKDPQDAKLPALSFSARFTLKGMTGNFSAAVQSQIDGQSTAPLSSQTIATTGTATGKGVLATTTGTATTGTATGTSTANGTASHTSANGTSTSTATAKPTSGATGVRGGIAAAAVLGAALVGVSMF